MRTAVTMQKEMTYAFPMTDEDILGRVKEVNVMRSSLTTLENKKKLLSQEIKSVETEMEQMLNNISRREEEREVQCDVCFE